MAKKSRVLQPVWAATNVYAVVMAFAVAGCDSPPRKPTAEPPSPGVVPAGTVIQATTQTTLSSSANKAGDTLVAVLTRNVNDGVGKAAIPAGSRALVTVLRIDGVSNAALPDGQLSLVVSAVAVDTRSYPVTATLGEVPHHLEWRGDSAGNAGRAADRTRYRDVIVSAGTPLVFTLAHSLKVPPR